MMTDSRKIRLVSDNLKLKLIIWLWISCMVGSVVSLNDGFYSNGRFGKRNQLLPAFHANRYGRSDPSLDKLPKSGLPKFFEIVPRMDRFFLGSRYGKRSSSPAASQPLIQLERRTPEIDAPLSLKREMSPIDYFDRLRQLADEYQQPAAGQLEELDEPRPDGQEQETPAVYRFLMRNEGQANNKI